MTTDAGFPAPSGAPAGEGWVRAYRDSPEMFDAFTRAEDPDGRIVERLLACANLEGRSTLEIGCGTGRYSAALARRSGLYVGVERSGPMLALGRKNLRSVQGAPALVAADARRLPFRDGCFDTVLAAWVVVHLQTRDRTRVLAEASRVLVRGEGHGLWLAENHWEGPFQDLRGPRAEVERRRIGELIDVEGFSIVDVVRTELRFGSPAEAERVLGYLCGDPVRAQLHVRPRSTIGHHVVILHRPAPTG